MEFWRVSDQACTAWWKAEQYKNKFDLCAESTRAMLSINISGIEKKTDSLWPNSVILKNVCNTIPKPSRNQGPTIALLSEQLTLNYK